MDLDCVLWNAFFDEESRNLQPLVTLELDDLAGLFIINQSSVASKFLMEKSVEKSYDMYHVELSITFLNAFKSFLASYSESGYLLPMPMCHIESD